MTAKALADLRHLVAFDTAAAARRTLIRVLPELVRVYGPAAASLSADWYEEQRALVAPRARFIVTIPEMPTQELSERAEALARWGVGPLAPPEDAPKKFEPNPDAARSLISGGLEKAILDQSRQVLTTAATDDPAAHGWQRAGHGECAFCAMLISRGAVYTRGTVDFASHNHCRCTAVPAWGGRELPVKPFQPSSRNITDADRQRVYRYLREHPELGQHPAE